MATQTDNLVLYDPNAVAGTIGANRSIDPTSDEIELTVVFSSDNLKRASGDPNAGAGTAGNLGDIYQRTDAGEVYVNTDGTATGWLDITSFGFGDVSGPASSTDNAIARFNGTTGKVIQNSSATVDDNGNIDNSEGTYNGVRHYGNSATDPATPAPAEGDRYYNTSLEMEMRYDGSRSKWLSVESSTFQSSDAFSLSSGGYHQNGNVRFTATRGLTAHHNGTVVSLGYTRSDSDSATFAVTADGTTIASLASTATSGQSTTLDGDFDQGDVLGTRNDGPNAISNSQVWVRVRWRA